MTTAEELIANAKALLLDFDGPVTALMPPPANADAADQARAGLAGIELPEDIAATTDHLAVLRFAAKNFPDRMPEVERACTAAEVACAQGSKPSPEVAALLAGAERRHVPVAVVSNNSDAAVRTFFHRPNWEGSVAAFACRTVANVDRLKPDPHLVAEAARMLHVPPAECVFIGDSVSDVQAGLAASVTVIGLAKTSQRGQELALAGAAALLFRHSKE